MKKIKIQLHITSKQLEYVDALSKKLDIKRAEAIRRVIDDHIIQNDKK